MWPELPGKCRVGRRVTIFHRLRWRAIEIGQEESKVKVRSVEYSLSLSLRPERIFIRVGQVGSNALQEYTPTDNFLQHTAGVVETGSQIRSRPQLSFYGTAATDYSFERPRPDFEGGLEPRRLVNQVSVEEEPISMRLLITSACSSHTRL